MSLKTTISIALQTLRAHAVYLYSATMASLSNFLTWCSTTPLVFNLIISAALVLTGLFIWSKLHPESPKTADNNPEKEDIKIPENLNDPLLAEKDEKIQQLSEEIDLLEFKLKDSLKDSEELHIDTNNDQVTRAHVEFPSADRAHEFFYHTTIRYYPTDEDNPITLNYTEKALQVQKAIKEAEVTKGQHQNIFLPKDLETFETFVGYMDNYYAYKFSTEFSSLSFNLNTFIDKNTPLVRLSELHDFALEHGLNDLREPDDKALFKQYAEAFNKHAKTLLSTPGVHASAIRSRLEKIIAYLKAFNEVAAEYPNQNITELFRHQGTVIEDMNITALAKEIAKYLKTSLVECMTGTPLFLSKTTIFGFGFDFPEPENPNAKTPLGVYFQRSAELEPLRCHAQEGHHPLVWLLEHPFEDYRRQDCSDESPAVDILNDSNNSSGVSDPETPEAPHPL